MKLKELFSGIYKLCDCGCKAYIKIIGRRGTINRYKSGHGQGIPKKICIGKRYRHWGKWALYLPDYYTFKQKGIVYEKIYNYQEYHKCCLLPWSVVLHMDGNPDNNMPRNLQAMTTKQHSLVAKLLNTDDRFCHECKSKTTRYRDRKRKLKPHWYKCDEGYKCSRCFMRAYMRRYYKRGI